MELNIPAISQKVLEFRWYSALHDTLVQIELPQLVGRDYTMTSDWGPMYTFQLGDAHKIRISYNDKYKVLEQKFLQVDTPIMAKEREMYPYFIKVIDEKADYIFYLYLSKNLELARVVVDRRSDGLKLYETKVNSAHLTLAM